MKKTLAIIIILAISLFPAIAFSQDGNSHEEIYIGNDTQLTQIIEDYAELLETREKNIEKYENMRLSRGGSYYYAKSLATKEKSILQVDYNIENKLDAIKTREAWLSIDFRTSFVNLYSAEESMNNAIIAAYESKAEYASGQKNNEMGFISNGDLLNLEYTAMASDNNALSKERRFESTLREFNYKVGYPLSYDEYVYAFAEEILNTMELDFYILHALDNVPAVKTANQSLNKYYIDQKYFSQFSFSTGLTYIGEALRELDITTRLQELSLEKVKKNLVNSITDEYKALVIEREKINLAKLNVEVLQNEYEINSSLYNRGFIDKEELSESAKRLSEAEYGLIITIYKYNTQVKSLEYKCAYYPEEGNDNEK